jgi:hypothetical protein
MKHFTRKRHIAKTFTWRAIGTMDTILLSWLVSGDLKIGAAIGGVVSEEFSPRVGLAMLPIMILFGLIILTVGKGRLSAANDIPTEEEDLRAMKDISNEVK